MNRKYLNMHIDQATPKRFTRKEKIILTIECIGIVVLTVCLILMLSISDIIESYLLSL